MKPVLQIRKMVLNIIDNSDRHYRYSIAKKYIMELISGLNDGDRIPSRNHLMEKLNVTRVTVDRAISELIGEGCLNAIDGSGTYVSKKTLPDQPVSAIRSWGIIVDNIVSYGYPEIIRGIEDAASKININVILCNTDNDAQKHEMYIDKLMESGVNGLFIVPIISDEVVSSGYNKLRTNNIPFVFLIRGVEGINAPKVISNNFYGASIATKHLLDTGYKRIAFISGPMYSVSEQRLQGYMAALAERGIGIADEYIITNDGSSHEEMGYKCMEELLQLKTPPDSVVTHNDHIALGAYQAIADKGLKIPDDIGIVGYDDSEVCEILPVKLTSVKYPKYETGEKAADILIKMMNGDPNIPMTTIINPGITIRESCGFYRKCKKI